ncbi:MAG TPA: phosphotransferase [Thermomicrobiaceae bacterium]|nr:phosphotransferase [Thermomicrobiaceae bacterium]
MSAGLPTVTPADTAAFLAARFGTAISDVRPLGAGAWSRAYAFVRDGARWVIRWSDLDDNFARDAFAARFAGDGLPIPPITDLGRDRLGFFAISPFVDGSDYEELPAAQLSELMPSLLAMFRALRRVDLSATTGFGIWDGGGNGLSPSWHAFLLDDKDASEGSLIRGWRARLAASPLGTGPYEALWRRFAPLVARCPNERRLIHSDLLNHNLLAGDGRITAVLDWGSSLYGDPLWDVAWFTYCEPWYPHFQEIGLARRVLEDFRADPAADSTDIAARLRCYQLAIGLDSIRYNAWRRAWPDAREAAERALSLAR